jgi:hypothetical protein
MKKSNALMICLLILPMLLAWPVFAAANPKPERHGEIKKGIQAEAACAIVGMSAEQSQLTALQRARVAAIEQAAGVSVTAVTGNHRSV